MSIAINAGRTLVSVVVPIYNAADTIEEALQSLLRQTYTNLEILVVDDGSDDRSVAVADGLREARVRIARQAHQGLVAALRTGFAQARGAYIARLDADDVTHERRIAAQVEYLEQHGDVGLLGSHARFEHSDGRGWVFEPPAADRALRRYLLWDNPFVHSSVMFRRTAYDAAGGYTQGANEDYRLWIRMARGWKLAVLPEVLVTHRIRTTSVSHGMRRSESLQARLAAQWEAAHTLGPWRHAIPALGVTGGAYLLALTGGRLDQGVRTLVAAASRRMRRLRPAGPRERSR